MDTNGAGDAFVGGFLAALAKGKDMEAAVPMSHCVAYVCTYEEIQNDTYA